MEKQGVELCDKSGGQESSCFAKCHGASQLPIERRSLPRGVKETGKVPHSSFPILGVALKPVSNLTSATIHDE